jgi:glyoxylase-like metal-dependent hydrolase (beta-lactamase superfamily II)
LLEELAVAGRPLVVATALEKPYIEGSRRLLKLTPEAVEQAVSRLPPSIPSAWRDAFRRTLEHPPTANVDCCIDSAEERPYEGGLMIVPTPGHTPGHISLYHSASRTLIAADALRIEDGLLLPPAPELCSDYEEALRSIERLRLMDIARIICFHGGLYEKGDIRERLEELPVLA